MSTAAQHRMPKSKKARALEREAQRRRSQRFFAMGVTGLVALLAVAIIATRSQDNVGTNGQIAQTRSVSIAGDALPRLGEIDKAVGMPIPEVSGESFDGATTSIERNGTPKMIVFLAHWCSHCRAEVPVIQAWIEAEGMPAGIEIVSVATSTDPGQANYPPSEWLEREGWSIPVIVDDATSGAAAAFGVDSFPFFAFVDADGTIRHRSSGELGIDHIERILSELR